MLQDREENIRRAAETAALFEDAGLVTIVTLISPYEKSRALARSLSRQDFLEVYIKARIETCMQRDPKQLYKKALNGKLRDFTGIDAPYEEPKAPDLTLDTEHWSEEECAEILYNRIMTIINKGE